MSRDSEGRDFAFEYEYQRSSCGSCARNLESMKMFCSSRFLYGFGNIDIMSMASRIVLHESFTYKLPPAIFNEAASALMCGGATMLNILNIFRVESTERISVVGMGGLGQTEGVR